MTVAVMSVFGFTCWPPVYSGMSFIVPEKSSSDASRVTPLNYASEASDATDTRNAGGASCPGIYT